MNEYDYLVLLTLSYSHCFQFALTKEEIAQRLPKAPTTIVFSKAKISQSLTKLVRQQLISQEGKYYFLVKKDLLNRQQKAKFVKAKETKIKEFVNLAREIPFIQAIILTGSSAVDNARAKDDLDFMIICRANTLWLTRLVLIILTKLKNKRPYEVENNAWCFNLLLDESDLTIPEKRRSLYEAYEILQMKFVFARADIQSKFFNANSWLKKYLFFYDNFIFKPYKEKQVFSLLNQSLFYLQRKYRQLVFGQEQFDLSPHQAFFNSLEFRKRLFKRVREKIETL